MNDTLAVLPLAWVTVTSTGVPFSATAVTNPLALTVNVALSPDSYVTALSVTLVGTNDGVICAV